MGDKDQPAGETAFDVFYRAMDTRNQELFSVLRQQNERISQLEALLRELAGELRGRTGIEPATTPVGGTATH